jgi:hypothetical protein
VLNFFTYCILGISERNVLQKLIFSYSNTPTRTKFDTDFKTGLKKFHEISEGYDFMIGIPGEMTRQIFKVVL